MVPPTEEAANILVPRVVKKLKDVNELLRLLKVLVVGNFNASYMGKVKALSYMLVCLQRT